MGGLGNMIIIGYICVMIYTICLLIKRRKYFKKRVFAHIRVILLKRGSRLATKMLLLHEMIEYERKNR